MSKTFNIYCDESCHIENDHKQFMFLGKVSAAYNQVKSEKRWMAFPEFAHSVGKEYNDASKAFIKEKLNIK